MTGLEYRQGTRRGMPRTCWPGSGVTGRDPARSGTRRGVVRRATGPRHRDKFRSGVLQALDSADWAMLETVRGFAGRRDGIGERADRLLDDVARAATDERVRAIPRPLFWQPSGQAVALTRDAARLASSGRSR